MDEKLRFENRKVNSLIFSGLISSIGFLFIMFLNLGIHKLSAFWILTLFFLSHAALINISSLIIKDALRAFKVHLTILSFFFYSSFFTKC